MLRTRYAVQHEVFRSKVRRFIAEEAAPARQMWESAGLVPREFYRKMGDAGLLGIEVPTKYGGAGLGGFKYYAVVAEEVMRAGATLGGAVAHTGLVAPYLLQYATEEQKDRWLPGFVSGEIMTAIAMTEPDTGSDLASIRTLAELSADGSHYVLNGSKTFITGGVQADLVLVVCRTGPARPQLPGLGLSILCVDTRTPGYSVDGKLDKIGLRASDTACLSFSDVKVPVENLLGKQGKAFVYLTRNLVRERLAIAVDAYAAARAAVDLTIKHLRGCQICGPAGNATQHLQFELASCEAEIEAAQAVVDRALCAYEAEELSDEDVAKTKLFTTETCSRVVARCLDLFDGSCHGEDGPIAIARLHADTRAFRLYGGTSEVMKVVISRSLFV